MIDLDVESLLDTMSLSNQASDFSNIHHCLDQLKPERRKSILLSLVYGLTHSELSEQLKLPLGTIKAWLRRGLIELRTCL
ncbi:MAG: DNA-directed RNA polymerase specialized sigma24 family protein [Parasphingorhabdus sp.]|jgi:DNA-directed RNA polymerase specialized sigma24 family protein